MREYIGNTILHFGWMFYGQECTCGYGMNFNAVARWIAKGEADLGINDTPLYWHFGDFFSDLAVDHFENVL